MNIEYKPYTQAAEAYMVPEAGARFLRTCILWQLCKFAYYNVKIVIVLAKGHGSHM
jgi:hypothetical protein